MCHHICTLACLPCRMPAMRIAVGQMQCHVQCAGCHGSAPELSEPSSCQWQPATPAAALHTFATCRRPSGGIFAVEVRGCSQYLLEACASWHATQCIPLHPTPPHSTLFHPTPSPPLHFPPPSPLPLSDPLLLPGLLARHPSPPPSRPPPLLPRAHGLPSALLRHLPCPLRLPPAAQAGGHVRVPALQVRSVILLQNFRMPEFPI